jgi:hypothetical protein
MDTRALMEVAELSARNDDKARDLFRQLLVSLPEVKREATDLTGALTAAHKRIADLEKQIGEISAVNAELNSTLDAAAVEVAASKSALRRVEKERKEEQKKNDERRLAEEREAHAREAEARSAGADGATPIGSANGAGAFSFLMTPNGIPVGLQQAGKLSRDILNSLQLLPALPSADAAAVKDLLPQFSTWRAESASDGRGPEGKDDISVESQVQDLSQLVSVAPAALKAIDVLSRFILQLQAQVKALTESDAAQRVSLWAAQQETKALKSQVEEAKEELQASVTKQTKLESEVRDMSGLLDVLPKMKEREKNIELLLSLMLAVQPRNGDTDEAIPGTLDLVSLAEAASDQGLAQLLRENQAAASILPSYPPPPSKQAGNIEPVDAPLKPVADLHDKAVISVLMDDRVTNAITAHGWLGEVRKLSHFVPYYVLRGTGCAEPSFLPVAMLQHRVFVLLCRNSIRNRHGVEDSDATPAIDCFCLAGLDRRLATEMRTGIPGLCDYIKDKLGDSELLNAKAWDAALGSSVADNARGVLLLSFAEQQHIPMDDLLLQLPVYLDPTKELLQENALAVEERLFVWTAQCVWGVRLAVAEDRVTAGQGLSQADLREHAAPVWSILSAFSYFSSPNICVTLEAWLTFFRQQADTMTDAAFLHLLVGLKRVSGCPDSCLKATARRFRSDVDATYHLEEHMREHDACIIM